MSDSAKTPPGYVSPYLELPPRSVGDVERDRETRTVDRASHGNSLLVTVILAAGDTVTNN